MESVQQKQEEVPILFTIYSIINLFLAFWLATKIIAGPYAECIDQYCMGSYITQAGYNQMLVTVIIFFGINLFVITVTKLLSTLYRRLSH